MWMNELTQKRCKPCEGGIPALSPAQTQALLKQTKNWELRENKISKDFSFSNFVQAMAFVNKVAEIAEQEGHHPDLHIHYNRVRCVLWTHAVSGLTENDFILAAKIDASNA